MSGGEETQAPRRQWKASAEVSSGRECEGQAIDLGLEELGRALVPQDDIGILDLLRQWQLLGNSLPGERPRNPALLQSDKLLGWRTGHAHGEIKPILQALFEEQRHLYDPAGVGGLGKSGTPQRKYRRVSKFLQPAQLGLTLEDAPRERETVDLSTRRKYLISKARAQRGNHSRIAQHVVANQLVRIEPSKPALLEQPSYSGFTTSHSAGDTRDHRAIG